MAARRPFWKWHRWKSIGFCLWPPSTCIWNLKLKFQSKLDLCSGNHVVYRQTDGRTDGQTDRRTRWIQYTPPPTSLGGGIKIGHLSQATSTFMHLFIIICEFKLTVRKRLSWVMNSVTLTFDLWPWPFAWTLFKSLVITPKNFVIIRWQEHSEKVVTDRQTQADRRRCS